RIVLLSGDHAAHCRPHAPFRQPGALREAIARVIGADSRGLPELQFQLAPGRCDRVGRSAAHRIGADQLAFTATQDTSETRSPGFEPEIARVLVAEHRVEVVDDCWSRSRHVVAKAEDLPKGPNPRFVVTTLEKAPPRALYEDGYCARMASGYLPIAISSGESYPISRRGPALPDRVAPSERLYPSSIQAAHPGASLPEEVPSPLTAQSGRACAGAHPCRLVSDRGHGRAASRVSSSTSASASLRYSSAWL